MGIHLQATQMNKSQIYNTIQSYIDAGYAVTPLNGKRPITPNWVNTPWEMCVDQGQFPGNFGVVLQQEDCIIDVDPRNFKKGESSLKLFMAAAGITVQSLNTLIVKTGGLL